MPGHNNSSFFAWPGSGLGHRLVVISRPQRRRTKPPIYGRAKETTPVRNLSVNRKPLLNCPSLAYPPTLGNGLYSPPRLPLEHFKFSLRPCLLPKKLRTIAMPDQRYCMLVYCLIRVVDAEAQLKRRSWRQSASRTTRVPG